MVQHYLLVYQVLVVFLLQTVDFEVKIESTDWVARWLIIWEMQLCHVGMLQCLVYSDSLRRIECEHSLDQVNRFWIRAFENCVQIFTFPLRQTLNEFLVFLNRYLFN